MWHAQVVQTPEVDVSSISPCNAKEADGRLLLHADHADKSGLHHATIRIVDSDVVVIVVYAISKNPALKELWIDFGIGRYRKIIAIHELSSILPPTVASRLPFFHAFTGCDTVSTFSSIGKRTAWKAWMSYREVGEAFHTLTTSHVIDEDSMKVIERFVVLMYDCTSACTRVNDCRQILYTRRSRATENIPPTADALIQHCKRAALQTHIWNTHLYAMAPVLDPSECAGNWLMMVNMFPYGVQFRTYLRTVLSWWDVRVKQFAETVSAERMDYNAQNYVLVTDCVMMTQLIVPMPVSILRKKALNHMMNFGRKTETLKLTVC
jgi:hypothetical protein